MQKLATALTKVVARQAKAENLAHADVCIAACAILTAYLERVPGDRQRRDLADCLAETVLEAGRPLAPSRDAAGFLAGNTAHRS